jgi:hypothetical protein
MSVAHWQREASWSAERQFRFAYETGALGVTRRILSHTRRFPGIHLAVVKCEQTVVYYCQAS